MQGPVNAPTNIPACRARWLNDQGELCAADAVHDDNVLDPNPLFSDTSWVKRVWRQMVARFYNALDGAVGAASGGVAFLFNLTLYGLFYEVIQMSFGIGALSSIMLGVLMGGMVFNKTKNSALAFMTFLGATAVLLGFQAAMLYFGAPFAASAVIMMASFGALTFVVSFLKTWRAKPPLKKEHLNHAHATHQALQMSLSKKISDLNKESQALGLSEEAKKELLEEIKSCEQLKKDEQAYFEFLLGKPPQHKDGAYLFFKNLEHRGARYKNQVLKGAQPNWVTQNWANQQGRHQDNAPDPFYLEVGLLSGGELPPIAKATYAAVRRAIVAYPYLDTRVHPEAAGVALQSFFPGEEDVAASDQKLLQAAGMHHPRDRLKMKQETSEDGQGKKTTKTRIQEPAVPLRPLWDQVLEEEGLLSRLMEEPSPVGSEADLTDPAASVRSSPTPEAQAEAEPVSGATPKTPGVGAGPK